ncbi:conserved hypothetical protein [Methanothermobacter sp. MT-2]|nr:conserved hypothetical protein [Methanothermobacter sp. MT-2]
MSLIVYSGNLTPRPVVDGEADPGDPREVGAIIKNSSNGLPSPIKGVNRFTDE